MSGMTRNQLLEGLAHYGYSLRRPVSAYAGELLLEQLLKQKDARLLEAFPAVLLTLLEGKKSLEWESPRWNSSRKLPVLQRQRFATLLALSYLLFELFGLDQSYLQRTARMLSKFSNGKKEVERLRPLFHESGQVPLGGGLLLSVERVNYLPRRKENIFIESSASA